MIRSQVKHWARCCWIEANAVANAGRPHYADRVITYHRFADGARDPSYVTPASFRAQMEFLAESCDVMRAPGLHVVEGSPAPRTRVRITIDDGHMSALAIAAPVLANLRLDAVFFIPTDALGKPGQLARPHVRELSDAGFAIGSHSCSHRPLTALTPRECERECIESRRLLEDLTGRAVEMFAYPFGTRADFDAATEHALRAAGYRWAFTSQHGSLTRDTEPLAIPRVKIENGDSLEMFARIAGGALDSWVWVDRHLWWLQRGAHRRPVAT